MKNRKVTWGERRGRARKGGERTCDVHLLTDAPVGAEGRGRQRKRTTETRESPWTEEGKEHGGKKGRGTKKEIKSARKGKRKVGSPGGDLDPRGEGREKTVSAGAQ